jgi:hypothetical protein
VVKGGLYRIGGRSELPAGYRYIYGPARAVKEVAS